MWTKKVGYAFGFKKCLILALVDVYVMPFMCKKDIKFLFKIDIRRFGEYKYKISFLNSVLSFASSAGEKQAENFILDVKTAHAKTATKMMMKQVQL